MTFVNASRQLKIVLGFLPDFSHTRKLYLAGKKRLLFFYKKLKLKLAVGR